MKYVIGVDLGTSALKSVLYNNQGTKIASASESYSIIIDKPGYSEQKPDDWKNALTKSIKQLLNEVPEAKKQNSRYCYSGTNA